MSIEIERKFLLKADKIDDFLAKNEDLIESFSKIEQIYLCEGKDFRIRKRVFYKYKELEETHTEYSFTKKTGEGLARIEETQIINLNIYKVLKNMGAYPPLIKTRTLFETGEELDSYNDTTFIMERESDSIIESESYVPWFVDIINTEVTYDPYYTNQEIAKRSGIFE